MLILISLLKKKSDSPDEDKSLADSKALLPVLIDFFQKHPLINPKTFLGDAAFDTIEIYKALLDDLGFEKALIPLGQNYQWKNMATPSTKMVFLAVRMIPHFQ